MVLALLVEGVRLQAQTPTSGAALPKSVTDYSGESGVFESLSRVYRYAADGTGTREVTGVILVNNSAAVKGSSVLSFDFASSGEHIEIDYIRVRRPDGTVISTPASDAQELPAAVTREAPFYSDLKQEQIPVRSLREGDHLEYKLRIVRTRAESPGHFWGEDSLFKPSTGFVVLSQDIEIRVPKSSYVQVWSPTLQPQRSDTTDEQVYHWHGSQPVPVAGKTANSLLLLDKEPKDGEPKLPQIAWTNFHTWAEVGAWYRGMEGTRVEPDDTVRSRAAELIADKTTEDAKARALYGYVSTQVRYIGVDFGVGRYQPHEASEVLSNQYGDCKDKHTLLASMLASTGITTDAVLIGAGVAFNEAVPSPGSFNHVITLAHIAGKAVWLDPTAEFAPYRLLNPVIRGRKSLVVPLTGEAHVETTPTELPFAPSTYFEATGSLDEQGTSHSHMVIDFRGDDEVPFRQAVSAVSHSQWDELMQHISQAMGYSGKVTNAEFSRPDDTSTAFHVAYDYEREKNGDWDNHRILAQIFPIYLADADEKDPPVLPIELGAPHVEVSHAVMKLPKGWTATLPADVHTKTSFATLDKTYKVVDGSIITDRRFEVLQEKVPAADWRAYHQWYKDAGLKDGELYIQLSNPGDTTQENSDQAQELIRQANEAEQKYDWPGTLELLNKAKSINPSQAYLWSNFGYVAMMTNKSDDAIKDFRLEIANHPELPNAYSLLAGLLLRQGKTDDAISTLRSSLEHNANEQIALQLAAILTERSGDYAAAAKVLRDASVALPDSAPLKMRLGITLLHQEDKHEGEAVLLNILKSSEDPGELNDSAYELANASLDLPVAETASRRSLELLDAASNRGETDAAAIRRSRLIISAWDTLGWILFQEGKTDEAEPWVRAAWRNGFAAEPGYHLAIIYQKQGLKDQALSALLLAAGGSSGTNAVEVQKLISAKMTELRKAGAKTDVHDARMTLQEMRTYSFSADARAAVGEAWATIEIAVTTKGINDITFVDGDKTLMEIKERVQKLNLDLDIPAESHATILRRGILSCHSKITCQLVLIPSKETN